MPAQTERDVSEDDYVSFDELLENLETDVRAIVADRQLMLDRLGMTEHEWACAGGQRFGDLDDDVRAAREQWKEEFADDSEGKAEESSDVAVSPVSTLPPPPLLPPPPPPAWVDWPVVWAGPRDRLDDEYASRGGGWWFDERDVLERVGDFCRMSDTVALVVREGCCEIRVAPPSPPGAPPLPPLPPSPPPPLAPPLPDPVAPLVSWLDGGARLPPAPRSSIAWTPEQLRALDDFDAWWGDRDADPFFALTGPAGSGKSSLVREIVSRYGYVTSRDADEVDAYCDSRESGRVTTALSAMTGKAAQRLSQCTGEVATTLHKILYWPPKGGEDTRFTRMRDAPARFVIVDESSMTTPTIFADLKKWARYGVRFLLVGDDYQLPPVITGDELKIHGDDYSVFKEVSGTRLQTVMRSAGGVLRAAETVRSTGEICRVSDLDADDAGYVYRTSSEPISDAVALYLDDPHDHFLITWRNEVRMAANRLIRQRLGREGELPDPGEPVLIKRNGQGYLNGEVVECGEFETGPIVGSLQTMWMRTRLGGKILVSVDGGRKENGGEFFDGGNPWVENWKKYHIDLNRQSLPEPIPVTFGYCLTCHSAQGSESRRVTIFLCRGDERNQHFRKMTTLPSGLTVPISARWVYTATTRSKMMTTMIAGR